jgi:hypothetical protein
MEGAIGKLRWCTDERHCQLPVAHAWASVRDGTAWASAFVQERTSARLQYRHGQRCPDSAAAQT